MWLQTPEAANIDATISQSSLTLHVVIPKNQVSELSHMVD
jgi:hypothetical protein